MSDAGSDDDSVNTIFLMLFLAIIYSVVLALAYIRVLPFLLRNCGNKNKIPEPVE